jgi:Protein of unknown function (DUF3455)
MPIRFATLFPLFLVAACTSLGTTAPTADVPAKLSPAANESLAAVVSAKGVQIYECRADKDRFQWTFVAPEAQLFDGRGAKIGKHYAGPHWESNDGSKIVGTVKDRADAPRADAIPWLLMSAKSDGPAGSFARVTSVQRVNTIGGVAPGGGCSQTTLGTIERVKYTADYYFFTAR